MNVEINRRIINELFWYLGPKPSTFCYSSLYDKIAAGELTTVYAVREYLKDILLHRKSGFLHYEHIWTEQAEEIWYKIEEFEKWFST